MIKIVNSIYNLALKYLMSDNKIEKLLIANLLRVEINALELCPQEFTTDIENKILA